MKEISSLKDLESLRLRSWGAFVYDDLGMAYTLMGLVWAQRPSLIIEYGTLTGYSASCMGLALKQIGGTGRLITIDACVQSAESHEVRGYQAWLANTDLRSYVRSVIGISWEVGPKEIKKTGQLVDMAFIDAGHNRPDVLRDFRSLEPYLTKDALVLFHDYYHSIGVKQAVEELFSHNPDWQNVRLPTLGSAPQYTYCGLVVVQRTMSAEVDKCATVRVVGNRKLPLVRSNNWSSKYLSE